MTSQASFRDPAGYCVRTGGRIFRVVNRDGLADFEAFLASSVGASAVQKGWVVGSRRLSPSEVSALAGTNEGVFDGVEANGAVVFEHDRIPFPSYPYEWPADMLHAAADLTLTLSEGLLGSGMGLKDATPYNILFQGPVPVFVDVLSMEKRAGGDPIWRPYAQFCRMFLFPLLMWRYWRLESGGFFLVQRDGIEPETLYRLCPWWRRLLPPVLQHVSLPVWLGGRGVEADAYKPRLLKNDEQARFVLRSLLRGLRAAVNRACPPVRTETVWSDYMKTHSYSDAGFQAKETVVLDYLRRARPRAVLDVGANTGHFSLLAAKEGARVVALDYDAACMGRLWRQARSLGLDVLPLVLNLARPTPPVGWRNGEHDSFLDRATGSFDLILLLAVVHHLLVTERVPLGELVELVASLTRQWVVVEYVPPEDPMFRRIVRGRERLHEDLTLANFEAAFRKRFEVERRNALPDTSRVLFLLRKKVA